MTSLWNTISCDSQIIPPSTSASLHLFFDAKNVASFRVLTERAIADAFGQRHFQHVGIVSRRSALGENICNSRSSWLTPACDVKGALPARCSYSGQWGISAS